MSRGVEVSNTRVSSNPVATVWIGLDRTTKCVPFLQGTTLICSNQTSTPGVERGTPVGKRTLLQGRRGVIPNVRPLRFFTLNSMISEMFHTRGHVGSYEHVCVHTCFYACTVGNKLTRNTSLCPLLCFTFFSYPVS